MEGQQHFYDIFNDLSKIQTKEVMKEEESSFDNWYFSRQPDTIKIQDEEHISSQESVKKEQSEDGGQVQSFEEDNQIQFSEKTQSLALQSNLSKDEKEIWKNNLELSELVSLKKSKNISYVTFEIVKALGTTTFQLVVGHLEKWNEQVVRQNIVPKEKQSKNSLFRRVYDVLNVLIGAGILLKDNKMIVCCNQNKNKGNPTVRNEVIFDKKGIKKLKEIEEKRKIVKQLKRKQKLIQGIILRNKNALQSDNKDEVIRFGFIGLLTNSTIDGLVKSGSINVVNLDISNEDKLFGEIDLLSFL